MRKMDPPMTPLNGTAAWVESEPDVLARDPKMAGLMVRIGMAVNALAVHTNLGYLASQQKDDAIRLRDNMVSLVMAASLAFEAITLARKNQGRLRPLLQRVSGTDKLLFSMERLLDRTHPASALLKRARNSLGFHWDYKDKFIGPIVETFATNEKLVWVEEVAPPDGSTVHRLSVEVLSHALLPEGAAHSDPAEQRNAIDAAISNVVDALHILAKYFTAAVVAYLRSQGTNVTRRHSRVQSTPS
jgi:hypothetical protein